jgi:Peptidase family M23
MFDLSRHACAALLTALCVLAATAPAQAFDLGFPLDCVLGDTCFIQQYMDRDPGPAAQDFTCGPLVYDGHSGTDIALPTLSDMKRGVTVRAAADGIVKGGRDGLPDISASDPNAPALDGRDCGNGVLIEHEGGWQTQYCHLKQGSITVLPGDPVKEGTPLGQVGMSGNAEFPHLHLTVRKDGADIDPFDPDDSLVCGQTALPLWDRPIPYEPGGIVGIGIATDVPTFDAVRSGLPSPAILPADAPALVLWAHVFGARAGDVIRLTITGPEGPVITEPVPLEKTQARLFRAIGKRLIGPGWPPGTYAAEAVLIRAGVGIDRRATAFRIAP